MVDHLNDVFKEIILHEPEKGLERFEEISTLIKQGKDLGKFLKFEDSRKYTSVAGDLSGYSEKAKEHFVIPQPDEDGAI